MTDDPIPPDAPTGDPDPVLARSRAARWAWLGAGWLALALGIVGVFLPVIPTTPFVLVAAWAFSKGSKKLHRALLDDPRFGPMVRDWERHGVIRPRAKVLATIVIVPLVGWMVAFSAAEGWTKSVTVALAVAGLAFVWSRPGGARGAVADRRRPGKPSSR